MMDTFDYPQMGPNCFARNVSTVSPQSLMLVNNRRVRELASAFADRVQRAVESQGTDKIETAYHIALSRPPSDSEREIGIAMLSQLESDWDNDSRKALETYCHMILNSASFLFVD